MQPQEVSLQRSEMEELLPVAQKKRDAITKQYIDYMMSKLTE
jgi:hypothetical protein